MAIDYLKSNKIIVIDDFFDDFEYILPTLKAIPQWTADEHPENGDAGNWPGKRSMDLLTHEPMVGALFIKHARPFVQRNSGISLYTHTRLEADNDGDGIHTDAPFAMSAIVYLSETNLDSGTVFFNAPPDKGGRPENHIGFVQNRAVFFSAGMFHGSAHNFGDSKDNGRLTMNMFAMSNKRGGCGCG